MEKKIEGRRMEYRVQSIEYGSKEGVADSIEVGTRLRRVRGRTDVRMAREHARRIATGVGERRTWQ